ncbi:hypothetical protein K1T71_001734 [Dendrolimus kikuchii]|uniref:Uncharacterized protein n=1 Tax=Dendrolimus kikuchii TaxID=765133 RepID=A0ACC1DEZ9_9NEOP|nr:hypothetical protein K1T71_001734 [Dendrolimus kikuchii]
MGGVKKYFRNEFQVQMLYLEYESPVDFYVSSVQVNRSTVPLLCVRTIVFLGCLGIFLASTIMTSMSVGFGYWPIYLTHWGLVLITVTSAFALAVSIRAYFVGPIDGTFGLPWYVKAYWIFYNTSVPVALFISIFYWIMLAGLEGEEFSINPVLDVFIHAVNSILMLILLVFCRHPCRILHFIHPLIVTLIYLIFSIIYYYAGGTNPLGEVYIYPMLDWSDPGTAAVTTVLSAFVLLVMYIVVILLTLTRNALTKRCTKNSRSLSVSNAMY